MKTSNPVCFAGAAKLVSCNYCIYFKTTNGQFLLFQALGISRVILQAPGLKVSEIDLHVDAAQAVMEAATELVNEVMTSEL